MDFNSVKLIFLNNESFQKWNGSSHRRASQGWSNSLVKDVRGNSSRWDVELKGPILFEDSVILVKNLQKFTPSPIWSKSIVTEVLRNRVQCFRDAWEITITLLVNTNVLNDLHSLFNTSHLILTTTLYGKCCCYSHFIEEDSKAWSTFIFIQGHSYFCWKVQLSPKNTWFPIIIATAHFVGSM